MNDKLKKDILKNIDDIKRKMNMNTEKSKNEKNFLERFKDYCVENMELKKDDESITEAIQRRQEFEEEYPLEKIKVMRLEEYAIGTENSKNSLSYQLENGKYKYVGAGIGGGSAAKFGIYYKKDADSYCGKNNEIIDDYENFWENFRNKLYSFIVEINSEENIDSLSYRYRDLSIVQAVLTKLCFLYYPEKVLNFCERSKLIAISKALGIKNDKKELTPVIAYRVSKYLKENIQEIEKEDKFYIGYLLWDFVNDYGVTDMSTEIDNQTEMEKYEEESFLSDVFITKEKYDSIVSVLKKKKNIILEGAPGVGKTFMAKKLAYSLIGFKDNSKIEFVQFHQNYGYEDFVEGYRPVSDGFELQKGIFYDFCKKAEENSEENYYLIIDEINRGNLSKIFGELLMLIESDKRNQKVSLLYSKSKFSVPDNLYIIGLMNTADRSLALIDYALRRRFSFISIEPAFENSNFLKYYENTFSNFNNASQLLEIIKELNDEIENDVSLGKGFKIGHSYFCNLNNVSSSEIKNILEYEIIPLLEEYWYDNSENVDKWVKELYGVLND